jgi:hypothetical protein
MDFFGKSPTIRISLMCSIVPVVTVLLLLTLPACASEAVKRGTYEAVYQKHCMDSTGAPNCDPEHKSYDEYKKDREEVLKRDR